MWQMSMWFGSHSLVGELEGIIQLTLHMQSNQQHRGIRLSSFTRGSRATIRGRKLVMLHL
jgi:hypothetical protein